MFIYCCPTCGAPFDTMMVIDKTNIPTKEELEMRPSWAETVGKETLLCSCNEILTWYNLIACGTQTSCNGNFIEE